MRPATSVATLFDLSYGYGLKIQPNELSVDLPYFGRIFTPSMDPSRNGLKFSSKSLRLLKRK